MTHISLNEVLHAAEAQGCRIERGKNCHFKIYPKRGPMIVASSTPSDHRSLRDTIARLRRAGIVVGPR
jgi:hypothetical protein